MVCSPHCVRRLWIAITRSVYGPLTCWTLWGSNPAGGGVRFSASVHTGRGSNPASYTIGTESFLGVKRPERGANHQPPPSSAEVSWQVVGQGWRAFLKGACSNCLYVPIGILKSIIRCIINYCVIITNAYYNCVINA